VTCPLPTPTDPAAPRAKSRPPLRGLAAFGLLGIGLLAAGALSGCGGKQDLVAVRPATYDFGRVLKGQQPSHVFTLTNNSDRVVTFKAQPNCSCFAVAQGLRPLDPGQSMEFRVLFDTTALPPQEVKGKWVTIHTDHADVGSILVPLKGEIYRAYTFGPEDFGLSRIDGHEQNYEPRTVMIRPLEKHVVRYRGNFQMPPVFDVEVTRPAEGGLDIHLSLKKDARRPVGPFHAKVRIDLEVVSASGEARNEERLVEFQGFWALPP
jgi:hypothetical protein